MGTTKRGRGKGKESLEEITKLSVGGSQQKIYQPGALRAGTVLISEHSRSLIAREICARKIKLFLAKPKRSSSSVH